MTIDLRRNDRFEMLMWLVALIILALLAGVLLAKAEPCLTKEQARSKWPTQHIWWHGSEGDRCWNNNKSSNHHFSKRESKPKEENLTPRPAPPARADANGNVAAAAYATETDFNEIDAQADKSPTVLYPPMILATEPPLAAMLTPTAMTKWPVILDVDVQQAFTPWAFRVAGQFN